MTKQLYRIERRPAKAYEAYAYTPANETYAPVNVLVPVEPTPGTLEWARGIVRDGGAVWHDGWPMHLCNGDLSPDLETGWHLWGDREWLRALPDGTRVHRGGGERTKRLGVLYHLNGSFDTYIGNAPDSGWDLAREPATEPTLDVKAMISDLKDFVEALERKAGA